MWLDRLPLEIVGNFDTGFRRIWGYPVNRSVEMIAEVFQVFTLAAAFAASLLA